MDKLALYVQAIRDAYPELDLETVRLHQGDGQFNDILFVGDALIFRFPRYAEAVEALATETAILSRIQGNLPLPIPNPIYVSTDMGTIGRAFMGYCVIPGEPLWHETLATISDEGVLQRLATQLAGFLRALHHIPIEKLGLNLPVHDGRDEWAQLYAESRADLFPYMRPTARAAVVDHFETYLSTPRLHAFQPVLRHGDFGAGNILYDRRPQAISGVIDFGHAGLGDPALDIAAASSYGEAFLRRFYSAYPEIEAMRERARFYRGTYALQEALHGLRNNDPEAFESGMAAYV